MTLTPDDRARCAAALRPANAETLMRDAEAAVRRAIDEREHIARMGGKPSQFGVLDRLAALALAVATMQERKFGLFDPAKAEKEFPINIPFLTSAALAALVERDA